MFNKIRFLSVAFLFVLSSCTTDSAYPRPAKWAQPVTMPGLSNLYKVADNLYRGAMPKTNEGIESLKKLGIRTVINLRKTPDSFSGHLFRLIHLPSSAHNPKISTYQQFIAYLKDKTIYPVFIHCKHGADRTGTAIALYRIVIQKWQKEEAIREMIGGGYGFHRIYTNLPQFVWNFPAR